MAQAVQATLLTAETGSNLTGSDMQAWLATLNQQEIQVYQTVIGRKTLQKLRQIEKAVHFMESRSDAAASLPSEVDRHYHRFVVQAQEARQTHDHNSLTLIQTEWDSSRRDAVFRGWSGGCLIGLYRMCCLPRRV